MIAPERRPTRRPFVAGNWKMNTTLSTARALVAEVAEGLPWPCPLDVVVCPPAVYLIAVAEALGDTGIRLGAQNIWPAGKGAFTGEISIPMVQEAGCSFVIIGHSERRHTIGGTDGAGRVVGEDNTLISRKVGAVLAAGMEPILCVGETLAQRDANETNAVLENQTRMGLQGVSSDDAGRVIIAYEPVWAIGTGRNATSEQAEEAHRHIREVVADQLGSNAGAEIRIVYGGSVKPDNAAELMACPDVDGGLIGGASLAAGDFLAIIRACIQAKGLD